MINYPIIEVLLEIWPELPVLAGEQWISLESQLKILLTDFDATSDSGQQARICTELQLVLESVPAVIDRLDAELALTTRSAEDQATRGIISARIRSIFERRGPSDKTFTCYTDIACPRRVWINTQRVVVAVRLKQHPSVFSAASQPLQVSQALPVLVQIDAPGFKVHGLIAQEITVIPNTDSAALVFDLTPLQVGYTSVSFDFIQGGNPIGTASLPVEITETEVSMRDQSSVELPLRTVSGEKPPDFILFITYEPLLNPLTLNFRLLRNGEILPQEFRPIILTKAPEEHTREVYRRLTKLAEQSDPTTHALYGTQNPLTARKIEEQLQEEGKNLWNNLIPPELQDLYIREREQWRDKSLLIISDEPHIPWELLWPYGDWQDDGPLCLQMNLSRWLRRSAQGRAIHQPELVLHMQDIAVIVPTDTQLPAAAREHSLMLALIREYGLNNISPPEPTSEAVKQLLRQGGYNWMHIATHGNFYPADPDGESAIWFMDNQPLTARSIIGQEIEKHLREQRPAFFFNACEVGQQGWAITGIGGWASRLIGAGAGLFLAPLWVVNDRTASQFSTAVYQALLKGKTAAEAVRQGRLAARRVGDPTWLAYSLYAHPNAHV